MSAWSRLLADDDWCRGRGRFPLPAYSEYLPPPYLFPKPYGDARPPLGAPGRRLRLADHRIRGRTGTGARAWKSSPAMRCTQLVRLGRGQPTPHISRSKLRNNPYWPASLAARAGQSHPRTLRAAAVRRPCRAPRTTRAACAGRCSAAASRGRARPFWRSFFTAPGVEAPLEEAHLLPGGAAVSLLRRPRAPGPRSGEGRPARAARRQGRPLSPLRRRPAALVGRGRSSTASATASTACATCSPSGRSSSCRPRSRTPTCEGELHLLPFPGSLVFWGVAGYRSLQKAVALRHADPAAADVRPAARSGGPAHPAVRLAAREGRAGEDGRGPDRPLFVRTHRWQKVLRHQDEVSLVTMGDRVTRVLFSTDPDDIQLYNKPMARNAQIWSRDFRLVLDGPRHRQRRDRASRGAARQGRRRSAIASSSRPCASGRGKCTGIGRWRRSRARTPTSPSRGPALLLSAPDRLPDRLSGRQAGPAASGGVVAALPRPPRASRGGGAVPPRDVAAALAHDEQRAVAAGVARPARRRAAAAIPGAGPAGRPAKADARRAGWTSLPGRSSDPVAAADLAKNSASCLRPEDEPDPGRRADLRGDGDARLRGDVLADDRRAGAREVPQQEQRRLRPRSSRRGRRCKPIAASWTPWPAT